MSPQKILELVELRVKSVEPVERWFEVMKHYVAYFLTVDQMTYLCHKYASDTMAVDSLEFLASKCTWFEQFGMSVEKFGEEPRPFIWDIHVLRREFPDFVTFFVTREDVDYSQANELGDGRIAIEWLEEYGLIKAGGLLFSRSIQPVAINNIKSEPIILAFPESEIKVFQTHFDMIPGWGGGAAFKSVYAPSHLDINFGDTLGIDGVDTVMCCTELDKFGLEAEPYVDARSQGHRLIG